MSKSLTAAGLAAAFMLLTAPLGGHEAVAAPVSAAATSKSVTVPSMAEPVRYRRRVVVVRPYRPVYVYRPWRPYYVYPRPGIVISAGIPLYAGYHYGYRPCSYYYRKWKYTGKRYWRNRYYRCRGWW